MKILTIDIETSGLPPKNARYNTDFNSFPRVVSIAWKVNDDPAVGFIINQEGFKIPEESIKVHGITNEMAEASAYTIGIALKMLVGVGAGADKVIGHNLYFDTSIIKANVLRLKEEYLYECVTNMLHKDKRIDTMRASTKFCALPGNYGFKWPKLGELYTKLFDEDFNAHNSKDDVEATYRCFNKLIELKIIEIE